jgi:tetratricopeptide (TPR) repeat protein
MYSFNHDEAIRSFERAARLDPQCAMAHWGIALSNGPHINNPAMDEARSRAAWDALQRARALASACSPVERALIEALGARYADPARGPLPLDPVARAPLDRAYADAMRRVHESFPTDVEVGTLCAEALMDLRPWDLWAVDGSPRPETAEITTLLEGVLARQPDHPGANHLYIHAVEASPEPGRAEAAADRLRTLVPGSGHMVHMPSHIDVRTGRWRQAAEQNRAAMKVHDRYLKSSPKQGFYRAYMFHNTHFLAYTSMMSGRRADSIAAARQMMASIPEDFHRDFAPIVDAYAAIEVEALMRFGDWRAILAEPEPRASLPITRSMWRFARGVAMAAEHRSAEAREEQRRFREQVGRVPEGAMMAINPASKVLSIADLMLEGEILFSEGNADGAVARLREAAAIEDTLMYMEPPDWVQPVRHALGAILLEEGRPAEAIDVYREDLRRWPENGWSLYGMAEALEQLGRAAESTEFRARYRRAFEHADVDLAASCACVKSTVAGR